MAVLANLIHTPNSNTPDVTFKVILICTYIPHIHLILSRSDARHLYLKLDGPSITLDASPSFSCLEAILED